MIYENHQRERVVMLPIALESGTFSLKRHTLQLHFFWLFTFFTVSFESIPLDLHPWFDEEQKKRKIDIPK